MTAKSKAIDFNQDSVCVPGGDTRAGLVRWELFGNVIRFTVMAGLDSDSTAATAGSIAGAMFGARRIEAKWSQPLNDTVHGNIVGYQPVAISECARRSLEICRRVPDFAALAAARTRKRGKS